VLKVLMSRFQQGAFNLARNGRPVTETHEARSVLGQTLDQQLGRLSSCSLLVA
jgi:hypothetical protein